MKNLMKIVSLVLVVTMMLAMSASTFAANDNKIIIPIPIIGEGSSINTYRIIDSTTSSNGALEATSTDMEQWNNIYKKDLSKSTEQTRATWSSLDPFTYYGQETSYSCGPASVKMALKYITGTAYSESSIRTGCSTTTSGTYLSNMVTYINGVQSGNNYVAKYQQSMTNMKNHLYSGVVSYDAPPIIGVAFSTSDGWDFNTGGHFLTIYSVMSDKTAFAICDPWGGYGGTTRWYTKSDTDLYNAYNSVNIGYMY